MKRRYGDYIIVIMVNQGDIEHRLPLKCCPILSIPGKKHIMIQLLGG